MLAEGRFGSVAARPGYTSLVLPAVHLGQQDTAPRRHVDPDSVVSGIRGGA